MSVTQEDIAKHLGVRREWVARALNGSPRVSEASRERIWACARELGYDQHTNREARFLSARRLGRQLKSGIIAVAVPNNGEVPALTTPFFSSLMLGMQSEAERRGIDLYLTVASYGSDLPRLIRDRGVDGVICLAPHTVMIDQLCQRRIATVTIMTEMSYGYALVVADREGTREATNYLISLGHRRIAYLGPPLAFPISEDRVAGYREALTDASIAWDEGLVETTIQATIYTSQAIESLCNRRSDFTALVCYNDAMAIEAVRYMQHRGMEVPRDVSVVGFDDIAPEVSFRPVLTSLAFDRPAMGRRAVSLVADHADSWSGKPLDDVELLAGREVFPVQLAVHETTLPFEQ